MKVTNVDLSKNGMVIVILDDTGAELGIKMQTDGSFRVFVDSNKELDELEIRMTGGALKFSKKQNVRNRLVKKNKENK